MNRREFLAATACGLLPTIQEERHPELQPLPQNVHEKWDLRFLDLARLVATWSRDPSTQCGAVIVRPNKTVCSVGFNGFPKGMRDDADLYLDREEKYSRIVHCELNALIFAGEDVTGYTLYTVPFLSCDRCAVHMIQSGLRRCVAPQANGAAGERWAASLAKTRLYYREAGVAFMEYPAA